MDRANGGKRTGRQAKLYLDGGRSVSTSKRKPRLEATFRRHQLVMIQKSSRGGAPEGENDALLEKIGSVHIALDRPFGEIRRLDAELASTSKQQIEDKIAQEYELEEAGYADGERSGTHCFVRAQARDTGVGQPSN